MSGAVSRTERYKGSTTVVGCPARAWYAARPLTASPKPPVRAKGQYSAARWTTGSDSGARTGVPGLAPVLRTTPLRRGLFAGIDAVTSLNTTPGSPKRILPEAPRGPLLHHRHQVERAILP